MIHSQQLYELFQNQKLGEDYSIQGLRFLPEPERTKKTEEVVAKHFNEERGIGNALKVAKLLSETKRTEWLTKILVKCFGEDKLLHAIEAADLLPEPERTEWLTKILVKCLDTKGEFFTEAKMTADLLLK